MEYLKRKRRFFTVFFAFCLMISLFTPVVGAAKQQGQPDIRVRIQSDMASLGELKAKYGVRRDFGKNGFTTDVNVEQLQALQNNKTIEVSLVEQYHILGKLTESGKPNKGGTGSTRITPTDQFPWGIDVIYNGTETAAKTTSGGQGIGVAILDTGVYNQHPDLTSRLKQCVDFTNRRNPTVVGSCKDDNGHGTHVSGTVLADGGADHQGIYGVAPQADLWAYKVLDRSGSGYADDIATAIRYAADSANMDPNNLKPLIISMSLGSSVKSSLIEDAVNYAVSKGVLVIAAAGNSGPSPDTISYPGALPNVVAVAALENVQENNTYRVADFSSRGNSAVLNNNLIDEREVEVAAPGRDVESTWNDGGYRALSGTSMATPHISGLAAKIWAYNLVNGWNNNQVRAELQSRAQYHDILGGIYSTAGEDISSGFGLPLVQ